MARQWAVERHAARRARKAKNQITLDTLKLLHSVLTPEEKAKGNPYRKDNPLHRLYFHEIAQPDKIALSMKKLVEWLDEEETQHLHPVERAARAHYRLMAIYPWPKNSGKVARLLMNLMLLRDGFPPVVIHWIERQRYYDVLRAEAAGLVPLVLESLDNGVETGIRFFEELRRGRGGSQAQPHAPPPPSNSTPFISSHLIAPFPLSLGARRCYKLRAARGPHSKSRLSDEAAALNASIAFDRRLFPYDVDRVARPMRECWRRRASCPPRTRERDLRGPRPRFSAEWGDGVLPLDPSSSRTCT